MIIDKLSFYRKLLYHYWIYSNIETIKKGYVFLLNKYFLF